ncbi:MAG TPA: C45 family peptidase [Candidatus Didemnitutus sp.]
MRIVPILAAAFAGLTASAALTPQQQEWIAKANRHEKAGWTYLHIEGPARERGFQHGYLLASEIARGLRETAAQWHHDSSFDWPWLVAQTKGFINPGIDAEDREELQGIVDGMAAAGVTMSLDELIAYNASLELMGSWWPEAQKKMDSSATIVATPPERCSSFIATGHMTADGGVVLGHNTMCEFTLDQCNLVIDIVPTRGHRILMQSQPGWIHSGADFFLTDAGLVGSETTIGGFHGFTEKGIPEFVRMRRATQDAGSIDGWCAIMKTGNNGGYANAWLLGDINSREIARLELGLKYIGFERTKDGYFVGSNIAEDLRILRMETDTNDSDIRLSPVARRVRWKQLMKENAGRIDLAKAKEFEGDCYDVCNNTSDRLNGRALDAHGELDPQLNMPGRTPFSPAGTIDAKVVDTAMARKMSFAGRWGSGDGVAFDAPKFLAEHPQFDWMQDILKSRPSEPWVDFTAGEN